MRAKTGGAVRAGSKGSVANEAVLDLRMGVTFMALSQSPITGIIDEELVIIEFGKHTGKSIKDVCDADPEFYQQLVGEKERGFYAIRRHKDKSFRLYLNPLAEVDQ